MMKRHQVRVLNQLSALIDQRIGQTMEPGAKQFANTFMEGAMSAAVMLGKNDLAAAMGNWMGGLQKCLTWAEFRQKYTSEPPR